MTFTEFTSKAYEFIRKNGYVKGETGRKVLENYEYLPNSTMTEVNDFISWLNEKSMSSTSDYFVKLVVMAMSDKFSDKDVNLVCSAINLYFKEIEHSKFASTTKFVGEIGDKIIITAKEVKELSTSSFGWGYNSTLYFKYRILDKEDNVYILGTSKEINEGDVIRAEIKDHKEFRGEKQTILKSPKIIGGN